MPFPDEERKALESSELMERWLMRCATRGIVLKVKVEVIGPQS